MISRMSKKELCKDGGNARRRVLFSDFSENDLVNIENYILFELCNPSAADHIVNGILETAKSLRVMPERCPFVNDESLKRLGFRYTYFENYNIFYIYYKSREIVYIVRILYNKADWQTILKL